MRGQPNDTYSRNRKDNERRGNPALRILVDADGCPVVDRTIAIAKKAIAQKTGARGLRSIIETALMNVMFEAPSDAEIQTIIITKECILNTGIIITQNMPWSIPTL